MAKSAKSRRNAKPEVAPDAKDASHLKDAEPHPASLPPEKLLGECRFERLRRSGPGGQHRNKVETMVRVCHAPTGVSAEAGERRSQEANRRVSIRRLRVSLAVEVRRACPTGRTPSRLWRSRCRSGRVAIGAAHDDFPALLAEALDWIAARDGDVKEAAESLGCTASQMVKLLKKEPRARATVNRWRLEQGLGRLA